MKIVQILHHSVSPFLAHQAGADPIHYDTGWPMVFARAMRARDPEVELECWRPERAVRREMVWRADGGIVHRVFPSFYVRYGLELSRPLLRAVKRARSDPDARFIVHGSYNVHTYLLGPLLARTRAILQSHGGFPAPVQLRVSRGRGRWVYRIVAPVERPALAAYPHVFALNGEERESLVGILPAERVSVSPVGVDFDLFSPGDRASARRDCGVPQNARLVLYVGRLSPEKGTADLIEAFAAVGRELQDARLVIVGSGPLQEDLRARAGALGLADRVCFAGSMPQRDLPKWYRAADVTAMPSLHEGFGMVAVESLACGTPVVAARAPGAAEIVETFACGVLVPTGNAADLAGGIRAVLDRRVPMTPAIDRARARYGWAAKLAHIDEVFAAMQAPQAGSSRR